MRYRSYLHVSVLVAVAIFCAHSCMAANPKITQAQIEKSLKTNPESYAVRLQAGKYFEEIGFAGEAQEQYLAATKCKDAKAEAFNRLAQMYLQDRQYTKARSAADLAVKRFPDSYGAHLTSGYIYHNQNDFDRALAEYKKAQTIEPKNPQIYIALGDATMGDGDNKGALAYLQKARQLGPETNLWRYQMGMVHKNLKEWDKARDFFEKNFDQDPFNRQSNLAYVNMLSDSKNPKKDPVKALEISFCLIATAQGNEMFQLKVRLKTLIAELRPSQVESAKNAALARITDTKLKARMLFCLGDVFDQLNLPDWGIKSYRAGLAFNPDFARGHLRLGIDLEGYGKDKQGALREYETALKLDAKDKETQARLQNLKRELKIK